MKVKTFALPMFFILLLLFLFHVSISYSAAAAARPTPPLSPPETPNMFIENVGQFAERARFQVQGGNGTMWLADDALWLTLLAPVTNQTAESSDDYSPNLSHEDRFSRLGNQAQPLLGVNVRLKFVGASTTAELEPFGPLETSVNYFTDDDPNQWQTDVPAWRGVRYVALYPDVDLEITGETGQPLLRLVCHANCQSALQQVRLQVDGAEAIQLAEDHLILTTSAGNITLPPLIVVVTDDLTLTTLNLTPHLENNIVFFLASAIPIPGPSPLPNHLAGLFYGTFLGGNDYDGGDDISVDGMGNAYITGFTRAIDFPTTPGTFDPTQNGDSDAFVVKLNSTGSALAYATFLGGNDEEYAYGIALDETGNVYVTGSTRSANFPTTPGALDSTYDGIQDSFVVKLNPTGSGLVYATFLGGDGGDEGFGIVLDAMANAYVVGHTSSINFPTTAGAFSPNYNGGIFDAFVAKLNPTGSALVNATYLGGDNEDYGYSIALDEAGNAYVAGATLSANFPTTPGAFDPTANGNYDAFMVKLNATGSDLTYATFLGGENDDGALSIVIDEPGNAYAIGYTRSASFPTTPGAFDPTINSNFDTFVVKLNATGSTLAYATFLGGDSYDTGRSIAIDGAGAAYVIGETFSDNFPTTPDAFDGTNNGVSDVFVARFNAAGSDLYYATFLGGDLDEYGTNIAIDNTGNTYITGRTESDEFPSTPGAFDPTYNGAHSEGFVIKLILPLQADFSGLPTSGIAPLDVTFSNLSTGDFNTCLWDLGDGATSTDCSSLTHLYGSVGLYTVALTVSGPDGTTTETKSDYIIVMGQNRLFLPVLTRPQ